MNDMKDCIVICCHTPFFLIPSWLPNQYLRVANMTGSGSVSNIKLLIDEVNSNLSLLVHIFDRTNYIIYFLIGLTFRNVGNFNFHQICRNVRLQHSDLTVLQKSS